VLGDQRYDRGGGGDRDLAPLDLFDELGSSAIKNLGGALNAALADV
jgi:hypothetical protein